MVNDQVVILLALGVAAHARSDAGTRGGTFPESIVVEVLSCRHKSDSVEK